jgi:anti-sigma regulatory factor (Ser/Thr protein kinase)
LSSVSGFRHEAVLYQSDDFVERIAPFISDGIANGEPTLVMVSRGKIGALSDRIGTVSDGLVEFRDMAEQGSNPARIIPAWQDFAVRQSDRGAARMRGVGEPIWPGRTSAQLEECHWHEALINRAFGMRQDFWLICPYDSALLEASVLDAARTTHPWVRDISGIAASASDAFATPQLPLASAMGEPERIEATMIFDRDNLTQLRAMVATESARAGMSASGVDDFVLAVSEVATNSIAHGGGGGSARLWRDRGDVVCEIGDTGIMVEPLADRTRPDADPMDARGLWAANQLCDLVQVRSGDTGSVVRLRRRARATAA